MAQAKGTKPATKKETEKKEDKGKIVKDEEVPDEPPPVIDNPIGFDTTSAPNDELTGAIWVYLEETGALKAFSMVTKRMIDMQKANPGNNLPDEFYDRFLADMQNGESYRWMMNTTVKAYRKRFTIEDMQAMITFFKTPAGKKLSAATPEISQESMSAGEKIGSYIALKIYNQLRREGKVN